MSRPRPFTTTGVAEDGAGVRRVDRREAVLLAGVLGVGTALLVRHVSLPSLEFDEQVYLASADLLARGLRLGADVFTSQPPLFLSALDGAYGLVGGDATLLRAMFAALTLAGVLAGWALMRRRAGILPALLAAALVLGAPGVVDAAAVVSADVPCVALGTLALLAAALARRRPVWGFAAGLLLACALLTKLLAAPFAAALLAGAIIDRPSRRAVAWFGVGLLAVAGAGMIAYADVLGQLWNDAVGMHLQARSADVRLPRPDFLATVLLILASYAGLLLILAAGLAATPGTARRAWLRTRADLLVLVLAGVIFCALQHPIMNHHLVVIAWPLALLAGGTMPDRLPDRGPLLAACAGALLMLPWVVHGRVTVPDDQRSRLAEVARTVARDTAPGQHVMSDLPSVALLAGRPAEPRTVDPSYVRVQTGELSAREIIAAAGRADAVVVGRSFRSVPGLSAALATRFTRRTAVHAIAVWTVPRETRR